MCISKKYRNTPSISLRQYQVSSFWDWPKTHATFLDWDDVLQSERLGSSRSKGKDPSKLIRHALTDLQTALWGIKQEDHERRSQLR